MWQVEEKEASSSVCIQLYAEPPNTGLDLGEKRSKGKLETPWER